MIGVATRRMRSQLWKLPVAICTGVALDISLMSAPAANALLPAPVSTMQRMASSRSSASNWSASSATNPQLRAFSLSGRLMVTTAIGSSRSTTIYCCCSGIGALLVRLRKAASWRRHAGRSPRCAARQYSIAWGEVWRTRDAPRRASLLRADVERRRRRGNLRLHGRARASLAAPGVRDRGEERRRAGGDVDGSGVVHAEGEGERVHAGRGGDRHADVNLDGLAGVEGERERADAAAGRAIALAGADLLDRRDRARLGATREGGMEVLVGEVGAAAAAGAGLILAGIRPVAGVPGVQRGLVRREGVEAHAQAL